MEKQQVQERKNYGGMAFLPLITFLLIYLGVGIFFTVIGVEMPFNQLPRHSALLVGVVVGLFMDRHRKFDEKVEVFTKSAGEPGIMIMALIFLLAGAFAGVAEGMGAVESVVNICMSFLPSHFLVPGIFVISAFISTAMGTSSGTAVAVTPIALAMAEQAGMNPAISLAAVCGGSMFGDNLSVISDTTIAATKGCGCEMKDKFRMNFLIAIPAAVVSTILFSVAGTAGTAPTGLEYSAIKILPYICVLVAAVAGVNVIAVLIGGTVFAGLVGMMTGTMTIMSFMESIGSGMDSMTNVTIMAILIRGLIGLIKEYGGIEWLVEKITNNVKTRKGAEYGISLLVSLLSFALVNNTVAIIIASPMAKTIGEKFKIAPKRIASLLDIFSCVSLGIAPHAGGMLFATAMSGLSPLDILQYSFYPVTLTIATVITIQFGLLRTPEEKQAALEEKSAKQ